MMNKKKAVEELMKVDFNKCNDAEDVVNTLCSCIETEDNVFLSEGFKVEKSDDAEAYVEDGWYEIYEENGESIEFKVRDNKVVEVDAR